MLEAEGISEEEISGFQACGGPGKHKVEAYRGVPMRDSRVR